MRAKLLQEKKSTNQQLFSLLLSPITSQPAMYVILQQAKIEIKEDSMMKEQKQKGEACFNTLTG